MIFRFIRVIIIIFSLATFLLSVFALVGSYKAEGWLTGTYLIDFHLTQVDLPQLLSVVGHKRDNVPLPFEAAELFQNHRRNPGFVQDSSNVDESQSANNFKAVGIANAKEAAVTQSVIAAATGTGTTSTQATGGPQSGPNGQANGFYSTVSEVIQDIADNLHYRDLGLADVYSLSFFGYCRGYRVGNSSSTNDVFDNSKVNFTWCSPPKTGYKFDPLTVIKDEITNMINGDVQGAPDGTVPQLSTQVKSELKVLVNNLDDATLHLPSGVQEYLPTVNNLTVASMAMLFVVAVLGFISIIIQVLAMCLSPDDCCASFLNFMGQCFMFVFTLVTAGLITGTYLTVRDKVNAVTSEWGMRAFISINLYAFIWSAAVAALLVVIFSALGSCCGLFGTHRRMYTRVAPFAAAAVPYYGKRTTI
ncbi:hypothetical protein DIURU_003381 [Diutina rugosa]|uniref:Uncharacterized protein n=1 Tax=Diutina rugosa TaxID=5481 RepID=A0A642UKX3_DIURU|nr:uncharacterized protein DIURU_003381 [Diutina rugosa]KAA8901011.1 hypothetical protein DIURU_003381 [Diutina rugosa]